MAGLTYFTARQFSLSQRQDADVHLSFANASKVLSELRSNTTQYVSLLNDLDSSGSRSFLVHNGQVYTLHVGFQNTIPTSLRQLVETSSAAATQRVNVDGIPQLVVGVS